MDRDLDSALSSAVAALRQRERTVSELNAWLISRGFTPDLAGEAVAELIAIGELDDERFAFAFANDKRELAGWGSERIDATLVDRGIPPPLADHAAAEPHDAELERATELARSRGESLDSDRSCGRVLSFLTRRGYGYEIAYDAIRRAAEAESSAA